MVKNKEVINICPNDTEGEVIELESLLIQLPVKPAKKDILFHNLKKENQRWQRHEFPRELNQIKSMDDWYESPREFQLRWGPYIEQEFQRRRDGVWFYNNGVPTYITGHHYMFIQWSKIDIGYPSYLDFQRKLFIHLAACEADPRCLGQIYTKCRRSGYTNMSAATLVDEGSQVKDKLLGIMSKTGSDAQEAVFGSKVVPVFKSYPFFFAPVIDGTTNPRMELAFREPSKRITKNNKTATRGEALDTIINWKNTVINAYDGSKTHRLFFDECFAKGTKILMSDMTFKNVEEISVGDFVMVDGGKKVEVAKTFHGFDNMFLVKQNYGKDYVVNSKHRLVLNNYHHNEVIMTPEEYLSKSSSYKRHTTRVVSNPIELEHAELPIPPYLLGLWLGDGFSSGDSFIVNVDSDIEILEYLNQYALSNGASLRIANLPNTTKAKNVSFDFNAKGVNSSTISKNKFKHQLRLLNLLKNKHIPKEYMLSSVSQRLELLAGIIDTDGHLSKKNTYQVGMSRKNLVEQIYLLAKSCGLDTSEIAEKKTNFQTQSYNVKITGSNRVPCLVERKKSTTNNHYSSRRSQMDIVPNGYGEYFGIQLKAFDDSDRRLILEDFTISMNCGKYEKGMDIREIWRIHRTCLIVGRRVIGKAMLGSTVNPLDRGGREFRSLYYDSNPNERNENGRTKSGLYKIFIPAYEALEGFFDQYGLPIVDDPEKPVITEDGTFTSIGARTFLKNERKGQQHNSYELNEVIRQFPFTEDEAFRDSTKASLFNITKIYEQIQYNDELFPNPVVIGNFHWENGVQDSKVQFKPDANGRWRITWMPPVELRNKMQVERGQKVAPNDFLGCGGVDSYDLDATTDGRSSKGACHLMTKFNMQHPSNMFVAEYASRPPLAKIFYEDVLMAAVFYGFPLLVENNKYGIVRYFESRGYDGYLMGRPSHLSSTSAHVNVKTKGIPSNSQDVIQAHAQAIESYIHHHVGINDETGKFSNMYFNRTLEDWINFKIDDRTKFDLTISSGLALLAAQKVAAEKPKTDFNSKVFFRKGREIRR